MLWSIGNSVCLGLSSAVIATFLALLLALGFREQFRFKNVLMKIILLPVLIPGIVGGVIYLLFFGYSEGRFGVWTTTLPVHVTWVFGRGAMNLCPAWSRKN